MHIVRIDPTDRLIVMLPVVLIVGSLLRSRPTRETSLQYSSKCVLQQSKQDTGLVALFWRVAKCYRLDNPSDKTFPNQDLYSFSSLSLCCSQLSLLGGWLKGLDLAS